MRRENKNHFRESEDLERFAREDEVGVMNRIECSAVDADFFNSRIIKQIAFLGGRHFNSLGRPCPVAAPGKRNAGQLLPSEPIFVSPDSHRF